MSTQITDPADRIGWDDTGREFAGALEKRYNTGHIQMMVPDFAER